MTPLILNSRNQRIIDEIKRNIKVILEFRVEIFEVNYHKFLSDFDFLQ